MLEVDGAHTSSAQSVPEGAPADGAREAAAAIAADFRPASVLIAGDAPDLLAALRARGIAVEVTELTAGASGPAAGRDARRFGLAVLTGPSSPALAEIERVAATLCACSDEVLLSGVAGDAYGDDAGALGNWVAAFARCGFTWDAEYDASYLAPSVQRFSRAEYSSAELAATYARWAWELREENDRRRALAIEQRDESARLLQGALEQAVRNAGLQQHIQSLDALILQFGEREQELHEEIAARDDLISALEAEVEGWRARWSTLEATVGWSVLRTLQGTRARLAPPGSRRDRLVERIFGALRSNA